MPKFMLILHTSPDLPPDIAPDKLSGAVARLQQWVADLNADGRYVVSDKLKDEGGKIVMSSGGSVTVTDGPYSELKEVVGGYFTIRANNYDEAVEIARQSPFLDFGRIAVRETDPMGCGGE